MTHFIITSYIGFDQSNDFVSETGKSEQVDRRQDIPCSLHDDTCSCFCQTWQSSCADAKMIHTLTHTIGDRTDAITGNLLIYHLMIY